MTETRNGGDAAKERPEPTPADSSYVRELLGKAAVGVLLLLVGAVISYFVFRPSPVAFASCQPLGGDAPLTVECRNESEYHRNVIWNFGVNSAPQVKDEDVVKHLYDAPGDYVITLEAFGQGPSNSWSQQIGVGEATRVVNPIVVSLSARTRENRVVSTKTVPISETKDDHPSAFGEHSRAYTESARPDEGFRIVSVRFEQSSATRAGDISATVSPNGSQAQLAYRLTSGPAVDRYRGWLRGTLIIEQERLEPAASVALVTDLRIERYGTYVLPGALVLDSVEGLTVTDSSGTVIAAGTPGTLLVSRNGSFVFDVLEERGQLLLIVRPA